MVDRLEELLAGLAAEEEEEEEKEEDEDRMTEPEPAGYAPAPEIEAGTPEERARMPERGPEEPALPRDRDPAFAPEQAPRPEERERAEGEREPGLTAAAAGPAELPPRAGPAGAGTASGPELEPPRAELNLAGRGLWKLYRQAVEAGRPAAPALPAEQAGRTFHAEEPGRTAKLTVEELDRAVRRDSRRYDGGITIF